MKSAVIITTINKVIKLFKAKEENKEQKITVFSKTVSIITIIVLMTCILNSLFTYHMKIDSWIYDLLEKLIDYITI